MLTNYSQNKLQDFRFRGQAFTPPSTYYIALIRATAGQSPRSTAVTVGQTTVPATLNGHMYRCSTAGTTGSTEPTWGTANNGTTTDGTAVWTEMQADFVGNTANVTNAEVPIGTNAYARDTISSSLTAWSGTQGAGTTAVSSGSGGTISNNAALNFPAPSPATWGFVAFAVIYDAATGGNASDYGPLGTCLYMNVGMVPNFPAAALQSVLS